MTLRCKACDAPMYGRLEGEELCSDCLKAALLHMLHPTVEVREEDIAEYSSFMREYGLSINIEEK